jgi:hypothetical protein
MKHKLSLLFVILGITFGFAQDDDRPEYTGENFSLEGALAMFKNAASLEDFEKLINDQNNNVNNLDLNNDGDIDYINVSDIQEKDAHVIVLSTYLSETEKQDIATIGIEKTGNEEATLQIEGDEELYAENTLVEPFDVTENAEIKRGSNNFEVTTTALIVNVWLWPCVRFIYAPSYVAWVSPHRWGHYPHWWKPWRPFGHTVFITRCAPHRVYFHKTNVRRVTVTRRVYSPRRKTSTLVVHNGRKTTVIRKNNRGKTKVVRVKRGRR